MPPKTKFSREDIVNAAFEIAESEGFEAITARSVAEQLGCSVAPIYVNFEKIDDLVEAVVQKVQAISEHMLARQTGESLFENLGRASLAFAREYPVLVREFVLKPNPHMAAYETVEESVIADLAKDEDLREWTDHDRRRLFFVMRALQTGMMVLLANGHMPSWLGDEEAEQLLMDVGEDLVFVGNAKRARGN